MANNGAVSQTLTTSSTSYTVPAGYHNGSGTVSISTQSKTVDPATTAQTVTPDTGKVLSSVTVSAVTTSNIIAGNIKYGTTIKVGDANDDDRIKGVEGTFSGSTTVTGTGVTAASAGDILKNKAAFLDGAQITGTIESKAAATYNTSTSDQEIASGQYLSGKQTIKAVTTSNIDAGNIKSGVTVKVGDANSATRIKNVTGTFSASSTVTGTGVTADAAGDILTGKAAFLNGAQLTGTMANNGATGTTLTTNDSSYTIPAGYTSGGTVTVSIPNFVSATVSNNFTSYQEFTANSPVTASTSVASAPTAGSIRVTGGIAATSGIKGSQVYNAVWNDLADAIVVDDEADLEFGYCYCFDGEHYYKSRKYLDDGIIGIHSDTAGFVMGTKGIGKEMNVAVAGFVLAYVDKEYKPGTLLTCTEGGILTEIPKQDKIENPEKVVASFWKPELKESWGSNERQVKVNGRMWVKVR